MARETEWSCPMCHNARSDIAYAIPCCHQFCLGCILRRTKENPECPLCTRPIETIKFSVREEDDFLQCVVATHEEVPDASSQAGRAPDRLAEYSPHHSAASPPSVQGMLLPAEQGSVGPEAVGGLLPEVWAGLFRRRRHLLDPVLPWLRQELQVIDRASWWRAKSIESCILYILCVHGPDEEVMVQRLQDFLEDYAAPLVHGLINVIVNHCGEDARRLMHPYAATAGDWDNSPVARSSSSRSSSRSSSSTSSRGRTPDSSPASSSSPTDSSEEEEAGPSQAAVHGGPGRPPSVCVPAEQEQPQEEPGDAVAAGPSAQGCRSSSSAPRQRRKPLPARARRPAKRRAPGSQDSPQPCKRPPRRRH
ncbi:TOPRS ligase, partial [Lophotis ruficrista]|nr:TOPRS ligase [Lophotis ruficrista]